MPEVLGSPPSPRTALFWNGTQWQWALVDVAGHLQIDTVTSALPLGAATAANQIIINTTVGLVALIRNALQTVDTDRLIVRGENQLHSFGGRLGEVKAGIVSGAGGYYDSDTPPAGTVWVVTNITAVDVTSATTFHQYQIIKAGDDPIFHGVTSAFGAGVLSHYNGWLWMVPDDIVRILFVGSLAGDTCQVHLIGHVMTLET